MSAARRLVTYELSFRNPETGGPEPEWTDLATGTRIEGGSFAREVDAVAAGRTFVNYCVERRTHEGAGIT